MRILQYFALLFIFTSATVTNMAQAQDNIDWKTVSTVGTLKTAADGQLPANLWSKYTADKATQMLGYLPHTLRSPAYKSMVRRLLLSQTDSLNGSVDSSSFLAKRIEMLIQYGLFDDAKDLYDQIDEDAKKDYDVALMGVALTMVNGDLAPACLDIRILAAQFTNMPAWRELSHYCDARFGGKDKLSADSLEFKKYPLLRVFLTNDLKTMPAAASTIETLIAFADNRISPELYNNSARSIANQNDLFIAMATNPSRAKEPTYQCYAIESAVRGISNAENLSEYYALRPFDEDTLAGKTSTVTMHPCDVPAFFYQRIQNSGTPKQDLDMMFDATKQISMHAFAPFAQYIQDDYDKGDYMWQAASILALNDMKMPESSVSLPFRALLMNESLSAEKATAWKTSMENDQYSKEKSYDLALPVYISRINSGDFSNLQKNNDNFNYDNFYSLTYENKSVNSSLGMNDALSSAVKDSDIPKSFVISLSALGKYEPQDVNPRSIAGILSSLGVYKLENEKHILAIEALH